MTSKRLDRPSCGFLAKKAKSNCGPVAELIKNKRCRRRSHEANIQFQSSMQVSLTSSAPQVFFLVFSGAVLPQAGIDRGAVHFDAHLDTIDDHIRHAFQDGCYSYTNQKSYLDFQSEAKEQGQQHLHWEWLFLNLILHPVIHALATLFLAITQTFHGFDSTLQMS